MCVCVCACAHVHACSRHINVVTRQPEFRPYPNWRTERPLMSPKQREERDPQDGSNPRHYKPGLKSPFAFFFASTPNSINLSWQVGKNDRNWKRQCKLITAAIVSFRRHFYDWNTVKRNADFSLSANTSTTPWILRSPDGRKRPSTNNQVSSMWIKQCFW